MNAKFQRIARRDKIFLNEQCNEIKENNTMRKTRDLFKKREDIRGIFYARMGMIKDRKGKDLTEEIKKRWQEYTEELYLKKDLSDMDNHDGVSHIEPNIPKCSEASL